MNMQQCILSILLLMDFWVVSRYWPWQIKLLRIRPYKILRRHILSFVLDKEPAVRLLGQKENAHLLLENKQPGHFVKVVVEFYTPTNDGTLKLRGGSCEAMWFDIKCQWKDMRHIWAEVLSVQTGLNARRDGDHRHL